MAGKCRKVGVLNAFTYILFYYYFFFEIPCVLGLFQMTSMQCTICGLDEGEMSLVGEKGLETLFVAASKKKETELTQTLKDHQNRGTPVIAPMRSLSFSSHPGSVSCPQI